MALVLKKLVSRSSTSVVVPYLRPPPNHHPRYFIAEARSLISEVRFILAPKFANRLLKCIPHTLRVTSRVEGLEARGESKGDVDTTLGTPMKFSLNIPGIEKITDTPENLYIFIDMGIPKNWVLHDLDDCGLYLKLKHNSGVKNYLWIEGYVQKLDIRRHYTSNVYLPPNLKANFNDFWVEPENGGVVVTISKQLVTKSSSSSSSDLQHPPNHHPRPPATSPNHHPRPDEDAATSPNYLHLIVDDAISYLGRMREMMEKKWYHTVDLRTVNSGREMHGRLRLRVEDRDKNFKVFLIGPLLWIIRDDGIAINNITEIPTDCFKSSDVVAIKGCKDIKVIIPLTTQKYKHDARVKVQVPFV
ncbi:uncharacterized protein [Rutidosis leptorrhynchoides]|uniref:uncharacterized protein isoform X2 n=1 Tax=Rutidosis leptorrhynchoides TaxID=125765 RepID=UPI003A99D564